MVAMLASVQANKVEGLPEALRANTYVFSLVLTMGNHSNQTRLILVSKDSSGIYVEQSNPLEISIQHLSSVQKNEAGKSLELQLKFSEGPLDHAVWQSLGSAEISLVGLVGLAGEAENAAATGDSTPFLEQTCKLQVGRRDTGAQIHFNVSLIPVDMRTNNDCCLNSTKSKAELLMEIAEVKAELELAHKSQEQLHLKLCEQTRLAKRRGDKLSRQKRLMNESKDENKVSADGSNLTFESDRVSNDEISDGRDSPDGAVAAAVLRIENRRLRNQISRMNEEILVLRTEASISLSSTPTRRPQQNNSRSLITGSAGSGSSDADVSEMSTNGTQTQTDTQTEAQCDSSLSFAERHHPATERDIESQSLWLNEHTGDPDCEYFITKRSPSPREECATPPNQQAVHPDSVQKDAVGVNLTVNKDSEKPRRAYSSLFPTESPTHLRDLLELQYLPSIHTPPDTPVAFQKRPIKPKRKPSESDMINVKNLDSGEMVPSHLLAELQHSVELAASTKDELLATQERLNTVEVDISALQLLLDDERRKVQALKNVLHRHRTHFSRTDRTALYHVGVILTDSIAPWEER